MKIFVYKCLTGAFIFFIVFQLTVSLSIREIKKQITFITSQENLINIKNKIRKEVSSAINKDVYLDKDDAILIKNFIKKIKSEINSK